MYLRQSDTDENPAPMVHRILDDAIDTRDDEHALRQVLKTRYRQAYMLVPTPSGHVSL